MDFIIGNVFRNPPILLGLIAALGLVLLKKKWDEVVKGAFLAAIGMTIIQLSVNILLKAIVPEDELLGALAASGSAPSLNDATFIKDFGGDVGLAMAIGFVLHLLIARFTPIKTVFLTGHMLWWFPFLFVAAGVEAGLRGPALYCSAAACSALYWSVMPWVMRKYVTAVTGDSSFTLGHPASVLALVAGSVARLVGNKEKSTEDLKLSKRLSFFREISITGGIVMFLLYVVVGLVYRDALAKMGKSVFFYALERGFTFGAGLVVLLLGVRMLIAQIVPAFEGISTKLIKGALPAYDCPMLFTYRPNAVIVGFLVALFSSSILVVICNVFHVFGVMLIPLVITSFFECGTAAVIADGQGGLRGAVVGTLVAALVMVGLAGLSAVFFSGTVQNWILLSGGNDFSVFGPLVGLAEKALVGIGR